MKRETMDYNVILTIGGQEVELDGTVSAHWVKRVPATYTSPPEGGYWEDLEVVVDKVDGKGVVDITDLLTPEAVEGLERELSESLSDN